MGLKKEYKKEIGGQSIVFPDAYYKITFLTVGTMVSAQVTIYDDLNKSNVIGFTSVDFQYSKNDDSKNYHKQGYKYMKTLPEYAEAIDVLEEGQTA